MRFKLRTKLLIAIIITTTLVFGSFLIFNNAQSEKLSKEEAIELAKTYALRYATTCKNYLDIDMGYTKAIANATQDFQKYTQTERDTLYGHMYLQMLKRNPKYVSVWNTIELQYTDPTWELDHGRKSLVAVKTFDGYNLIELFKDMDSYNESSAYFKMKQEKIPALMEPYIDENVGDFLITTLTSPLFVGDRYAGQGGIDFSLEVMQDFVDSLNLMNGAISIVLSNNGVILGHTNSELVGDSINNVKSQLNIDTNFVQIIQEGEQVGIEHEISGNPFYTSIVPFLVEGTETPWAFSISIPIEPFLEKARAKSKKLIWIGVFGMAFIYLIIYLIASQVVKPLSKTTKIFKELSEGNINNNLKLKIKTRDELEEMSESVNSLIDSLQKTESFAQEIEKGNLDAEFEVLGENDRLGHALLQMRKGLIDAKKRDEKRRLEDERRNWALDGLTKFADLLRMDSSNFEEYIRNLISNLANYTKSNQGAIYIVNNNDEKKKTVELAGSYAYEGDKFDRNVLEYGEGLIGVSIREAKTTYLTELPENYLSVSSGLGNNAPSSLIITPLKHNEEVIGAIELASFSEYEKYQIKFIEDVAESIAATIESLKMQQKSNLLLEQTQQQAEEMMAQEEELRQNMEEMMATQEEMQRNETEMKDVIENMKSKETQLIKILDELEIQEKDIKKKIDQIKKL